MINFLIQPNFLLLPIRIHAIRSASANGKTVDEVKQSILVCEQSFTSFGRDSDQIRDRASSTEGSTVDLQARCAAIQAGDKCYKRWLCTRVNSIRDDSFVHRACGTVSVFKHEETKCSDLMHHHLHCARDEPALRQPTRVQKKQFVGRVMRFLQAQHA